MAGKARVFCALSALMAVFLSAIALPASAAQVNYAYDAQGRLIEATYDNGVDIVYSYDSAGNRTSQVLVVPSSASAYSVIDASSSNPNCPANVSNNSWGAVCFSGPSTQYAFQPNADGGVTVTDTVANTVQNVENSLLLVFTDRKIYTLNPDQALIARLYRTLFSTAQIPQYTPDVQGLLNWYNAYKTLPAYVRASPASAATTPDPAINSGYSLIQALMLSSPYASVSAPAFVTAMYQNALNRQPCSGSSCTSDELAFWVNEYNSVGPDLVAAYISTSPEAIADAAWQPADTRTVPGWIFVLTPVGS